MTTIIPGPGEDGYPPLERERTDEDDERVLAEHEAESPLITNTESYALHLGARALAEVAEGLMRSGRVSLAAEAARSAEALNGLQQRATVSAARGQVVELEADR
jgi:hypothetical protein